MRHSNRREATHESSNLSSGTLIMYILILDDDLKRLKKFKQNLIGHVVECVTTVQETLDNLKEKEWGALFLDHDLDGKERVPSGPGTGYEVAEWLSKNPERQPKLIYVHSLYTEGAANMKKILPNAILAPGVWSKINTEEFTNWQVNGLENRREQSHGGSNPSSSAI
jgi:CheY-like chemotaxis protein